MLQAMINPCLRRAYFRIRIKTDGSLTYIVDDNFALMESVL